MTHPSPPVTPCQHEQTSTSHTGDGVEVVTCLECGKQLHVGKMPWPDDDETPASVDRLVEMRKTFKAFFENDNANVEWEGWGEGRVLVDHVFNLDELLTALAASDRDVLVAENVRLREALRDCRTAFASQADTDWVQFIDAALIPLGGE
jgi:NMD protein affecting ribosome stability and mRNA decay